MVDRGTLAAVGMLAITAHGIAEDGHPFRNPSELAADLLRECAVTEARVALGLATPAEVADEVADLLRQGDALLTEFAGVRDRESASMLAERLEAVDRATVRAMDAIANVRDRVCNSASAVAAMPGGGESGELEDRKGEVFIDPWAGPDQECGFVPSDLGAVTAQDGAELPEVDLRGLSRQIPPRFRLAEFLGLGRNKLRVTLTWIEPRQVRRKVDAEWAILVQARLRCEFVGRFVPEAGESADGRANPPHQPIETLRVTVDSRGHNDSGINRSAADFGNRDAYKIEDYDVIDSARSVHPGNPWYREELAAAAVERGQRLERVHRDDDSARRPDWLDAAIQQRLAIRQVEAVVQIRLDPAVIASLDELQASRASLAEALDQTNSSPEGRCSVPDAAEFAAINPATLLESGTLRVDVLERLVPLTRCTLRTIRRGALVDAADPRIRTEAAVLARNLERLDRLVSR